MSTMPQNCLHGVNLSGQKCPQCAELATDTHRSGRFIAARDAIEAQRGHNDVFPGDPYPVTHEVHK
jgi:hypothetical protein